VAFFVWVVSVVGIYVKKTCTKWDVIFIFKIFFVMYDCVGGDSRLKIYSVY
jgi:hypothetical protein